MSVAAPSSTSLGAPASVTTSAPSLDSPASVPSTLSPGPASASASAPAAQPPIFSNVPPPAQPSPSPSSPPRATPPNLPPKSSPSPSLPSPPPTGEPTPALAPLSEIATPSISPPPKTGADSPPPLSQSPPPVQSTTTPPASQGTPPLPVSTSPPPPPPPPPLPPPPAGSPPLIAVSPVSNPSVAVPPPTVFPTSPPPSPATAVASTVHPHSPPSASAINPLSGTSSNVNASNGGNGASTSVIVGIAVGGAVVVSLIVFLILCFTKKRSKQILSRNPRFYESDHGVYHSERDHLEAGIRRHGPGSAYSSSSDAINNPVFPPPPPPPPLGGNNFAKANGVGAADALLRKTVPPPPQRSSTLGNSRSWFTYEELEVATNGFSSANLLGEGGFGCVFKGQLKGGSVVAVKQLKLGGGQGEREFRAEVEIISRIHHRHLVSLVGYCIADTQRLLVYDYVPNGTLEYHLHGKGRPVIEWGTRLKIAIGAARGLAYLHEDCHPRIIHRDIKSSNILLDSNFEAQVSDFGLAKLASDAYTHVTTRVMGTFGYLAPEYASSGKLTNKSDVYSFGVVLLELITGRKPIDTSQPLGQESLVEWARPQMSQALEDKNVKALADSRLAAYDHKEMLRMVEAAAACVRHSAHKRPRMGQVVHALESEVTVSVLNEELKPGESAYHNSIMSIDFDSTEFSIDMRGFRRMGQNNQEYSSGYSGATSGTSGSSSTENLQRDERLSTWLGRVSQKSSNKQRSSRRVDEVEQPLRM